MHLQVSNVCKSFGRGSNAKLVLDQVSFSLQSGDFKALVGSSGSGKSTVMRLVAGLDQPSSGAITMDGQSVRGPGSDRGMVFQKYSLYPWLTAAENVAFGMQLQGRSKPEGRERTSYVLDVVGLADSARLKPRELSGGMQQRVAIARAVVHRPDLLIADEPTGNLDQRQARRLMALLAELNRAGTTVVVATHDEAMVARNPAPALHLDGGRLHDPDNARAIYGLGDDDFGAA
jgi:NitT/TauT family transport system ATP-binding protein